MADGVNVKTYYLATLGCPKNEVDSESLEMELLSAGMVRAESPETADLILINSCGFIKDAKVEAIQTTLDLHQSRKQESILVMCGCLPARYNLNRSLNEVDLFLPWNKHRDLIPRLQDLGLILSRRSHAHDRLLPSAPFAYLRVSEGCDNRCAYCAIPDIKGPFTSRPMQEIITEADYLCDNGARELVLIGQDTTLYGRNGDQGAGLGALLESLSKVANCEWIRVMYAHPAHLDEASISAMSSSGKVVKYLDLPLQHINSDILKKMNRRVSRQEVESLIEKLRLRIPGMVLRTTFIVGFPGETDKHFGELLDFCEEIEFDNVGVFKYSPEDGTPAYDFSGRVDDELIDERYLTLLDIQNMISARKLSQRVSSRERVLIHQIGPDGLGVGRGWFQAPDVDGQVTVTGCRARPGEFADVIIERSDAYDLFAREQ